MKKQEETLRQQEQELLNQLQQQQLQHVRKAAELSASQAEITRIFDQKQREFEEE